MRNHYRPAIQNGPIAKRARRPSVPPAAQSGAARVAARRGPRERMPEMLREAAGERFRAAASVAARDLRPSRVLLALIGCGLLIAAGFVFGLREHFVAHALNRAEVRVQSEIERATSAERALKAEEKQAGGPRSLAESANRRGHVQPLKLDPARPGAKPKPSPQP
jgi:hypothetical protein